MINKGIISKEFEIYLLGQIHSYLKNCDTSLCVMLFVEIPVRVLYMFDLGIFAAITSHSSDIVQTLGTPVLWFETPRKFNCEASFFCKQNIFSDCFQLCDGLRS